MKKWLSIVVAFALLFLVGFLWTPPEGLSPEGQRALGIALFAIVVWFTQAMSDAVSGIFIVFLLAVTGAVSLSGSLSGYSNTSLWLIVIGFVMAAAMEKTGLSRRIALQMLRAVGGRSIATYWAVFAVMVVLTFLVPSITARTLLMLPILLGIGEAFGAKEDSKLMRGLLFIVAIAGTALSIGVLTAHVGNPTTAAFIEEATGQYIGWATWFKYGFPPALILGIIFVFLIIWMWKPEQEDLGGGISYLDREIQKLGPITRDEIYVLVVFLATVILWATDSFHGIKAVVVGFGTMAALLLPGVGPITWKEAQARVPWNVFILYGAGLSMGSALASSGAAAWLASVGLSPIAHLPLTVQAVCLIWLVTALQVFFTGGGPKTTALTPVIIAHATAIGVNPLFLALPLGLNMHHQYMLPVSNMPNAVITGTPYVPMKDLLKTGVVASIVACVFFSIVVFTYWSWVGLF